MLNLPKSIENAEKMLNSISHIIKRKRLTLYFLVQFLISSVKVLKSLNFIRIFILVGNAVGN